MFTLLPLIYINFTWNCSEDVICNCSSNIVNKSYGYGKWKSWNVDKCGAWL